MRFFAGAELLDSKVNQSYEAVRQKKTPTLQLDPMQNLGLIFAKCRADVKGIGVRAFAKRRGT